MTSEQWHQVKEVFHAATELAPEMRTAFLNEHCHGNAEVMRELQLLLEADDKAANFIEQPALASASEVVSANGDGFWNGRQIGQYRVLREIGRGGMGLVLLAIRADDQFEKQVAIKVLRRGMDSADLLRRFRNERQILASLEHPHIAHLLDGGMTDDGLPYFVMEYVSGEPLDKYADQQRLSTDQRLQLFRTVCAAVLYAHQNLVVHRDLKPGNILITATGEPKLLDFGIAKVLNSEHSGIATEQTRTELRALTPDYASPEQVRGEKLTTTSDVYSLGVVLYELLTGHRPYRSVNLSPNDLAKVICEQEPTRPSTIVRNIEVLVHTDTEPPTTITPDSVSRARNTQPDNLRHRLAGDLDNIVLMAMRKDPQRRYGSVGQLSEDIRRHLEGLPVIARKDTFSYRATKFIRRNRIGVATASLVFFSLLGGIVATTVQARKARAQARVAQQERDKAQSAQARAEKINAFMQSIFSYANPEWFGRAGGRKDTSVLEAMRDIEKHIDSDFRDEPDLRADVYQQIGDSYRTQRLFADAERTLRTALRLRRGLYGEDNAKVAESLYILSGVRMQQGDVAEHESLLSQALSIQRRHPSDGNNLPYMIIDYASFLGKYRGDHAAAIALSLEALEIFRQRLGAEHYMIAAAHHQLAIEYAGLGDYDQAEAQMQEVLKHPNYQHGSLVLLMIAGIQLDKGNDQAAETFIKRQLAETTSEESSADRPARLYDLRAGLAYRQGNYTQARIFYEKLLASSSKNEFDYYSSTHLLAQTLNKLGQVARAESILRGAIEVFKKSPFAENSLEQSCLASVLGETLTKRRHLAEAERLLLGAYQTQTARVLPRQVELTKTRQRLAELYRAWGKDDEASKYE